MAAEKKVSVSFRVSGTFKSLLKAAAERQRRSQANLLEVLLVEYCEKNGMLERSNPNDRTRKEKQP